MATIAVNILWVLVALVILCLVVYLAFWVLRQMGVPIPDIAEKAVWIIVLMLHAGGTMLLRPKRC